MATVYILYSENLDRYYIGSTVSSVEERLTKHLTNHSGFTGKAKDWLIVHTEVFEEKRDALKRELAIKNKKSRIYIESLFAKKD
jgi:putative endonuclease